MSDPLLSALIVVSATYAFLLWWWSGSFWEWLLLVVFGYAIGMLLVFLYIQWYGIPVVPIVK